MAGGIGRFSRKKAPAPAAAAGGEAAPPAAGGGVPSAATNPAPGANGKDAAPAATERPSTAFAPLGADRPATSGSHGFSNISTMFGGIDDEGMEGEGGGGIFSYTSGGAEGMEDGNFPSFTPDIQMGEGFAGIGFDDGEEPPAAGSEGTDANGDADAAKPPAAAPPVATAGGAGIGLFAKKRAAATAPANAPPAKAPSPATAGAPAPPAAKKDGASASSVANLSVFDTDLVSKGTEAGVVDGHFVQQGGGAEGATEDAAGEVPKTIPTSGDDVEDDLTEVTAATFALEAPLEEAPMAEGGKDAEPAAAPKASPYFATNAPTDPTDAAATTPPAAGSPAGEDIVIPGITPLGQPSPPLADEPPAATKPSGATLSPRPPAATQQRVSLSPNPAAANQQAMATTLAANAMVQMAQPAKGVAGVGGGLATVLQGAGAAPNNQRVSLSPRPGVDAGAAKESLGATDDDDDNSIVIPGVPPAVANAPVEPSQFGLGANAGKGATGSSGGVSKFLLRGRNSGAPSTAAGTSGGIGTFRGNGEKVTFASNVNTANTASTGSIGQFGRKSAAPNSTAITPDHLRRSGGVGGGGVSGAAKATTPFARGAGANQKAVTPTPGMVSAPAPAMAPAAAASKATMEIEQQPAEAPRQRPRGQTIVEYTSPPPAATSPELSVTPKASNVNAATPSGAAFRTNANLDTLLEQFDQDLEMGKDMNEAGGNDLLEMGVELAHNHTTLLSFQEQYLNLIDELEKINAFADEIIAEAGVVA